MSLNGASRESLQPSGPSFCPSSVPTGTPPMPASRASPALRTCPAAAAHLRRHWLPRTRAPSCSRPAWSALRQALSRGPRRPASWCRRRRRRRQEGQRRQPLVRRRPEWRWRGDSCPPAPGALVVPLEDSFPPGLASPPPVAVVVASVTSRRPPTGAAPPVRPGGGGGGRGGARAHPFNGGMC